MPKAKRKPARTRRARRKSSAGRNRRAIEVALAGLAHDVRTPLTGILALADLLRASDLPERERRWAAAIKGAADHLARLTTIVVDAAKAGSAGLLLQAEPFAPADLARAVSAALSARAEAKGIAVDVRIPANLPRQVTGDAIRLRSALENLVDNAVKFTERGRIKFAVASAPAGKGRVQLSFTLSDSGIGISAADLKRLFRPFAQASEAVTRKYGGAGLGLVYVKRIAQAMGGTLTVTSRPGHGSVFRLTVKMARDRAGRGRTSAPVRTMPLRILSVEDNPYGRVVLSAVLGEFGHRVSFVGSGEAAVEAVAREHYDVVFMDIALAGIDGLEATRRIRALPGIGARIPIIGVSGRTDTDDAAAAKAAGMDAYLRKPATPTELFEALRQVTGAGRT